MVGKRQRTKKGPSANALSDDNYAVLYASITAAEERTGLEFVVLFGTVAHTDSRAAAERAFRKHGLEQRPAVMIVVVPSARKIEVLTATELRGRLSDAHCREAVNVMTGLFALGNLTEGLTAGIDHLALAAGNGEHSGPDLPNVMDLD